MKIHVGCSNLGDFFNSYPVVSGIVKSNNTKAEYILKNEMKKFKGIKEFLEYQDIVHNVKFEDEETTDGSIVLMSWTRKDRGSPVRPIETCRFENWARDNYKDLNFEVDDDCEIKVPKLDIDYLNKKVMIGDRWSITEDPGLDQRRVSYLIRDSNIIESEHAYYLDYSKDLLYNCSLIKYNKNPFITTFTGIGIISDLMKKKTFVCWGEDLRFWDGHSIDVDFEYHYYTNRNSSPLYYKDLVIQK